MCRNWQCKALIVWCNGVCLHDAEIASRGTSLALKLVGGEDITRVYQWTYSSGC